MQESLHRRRLRWKCRRGMLELDSLLNNFLNLGYNALTLRERAEFENLLNQSDQKLFTWLLTGGGVPQEFTNVIKQIRANA